MKELGNKSINKDIINAIINTLFKILEKLLSADSFPSEFAILLYCGITALSVELVKTPNISIGIDIARKIESVIALAP
jgi:hypothetical protein